jgi:hypothetical protein
MKKRKNRERKRERERKRKILLSSNSVVKDLSWILQLSWYVTRVVLLAEFNVM